MRLTHLLIVALGATFLARPAAAAEYSVKVSVSRSDPDAYTAVHPGTDYLDLFVFVDGRPNRGGEFGLSLEGAECVAFQPDTALAWITLPVKKPYPGTIAQAKSGDECADPPVCYGKMTVKPTTPGGRIVVQPIPSERAQDAAILGCDYGATNWFVAYPAVINPGDEKMPEPHVVQRPGDPPIQAEDVIVPQDDTKEPSESTSPKTP